MSGSSDGSGEKPVSHHANNKLESQAAGGGEEPSEAPETHIENTTVSTMGALSLAGPAGVPSTVQPRDRQDVSVISGVTNPLETRSSVARDVPAQVILPESEVPVEEDLRNSPVDTAVAAEDAKETTSSEPPVVVKEGELSKSAPAPQAVQKKEDSSVVRAVATAPTNIIETPAAVRRTSTHENGIDFIQSPEMQNAIAERSPGGRYVRFMEKLGSGASKDVYRAYDTQEGIEVAWNVVNLSGVPKNDRNRIVNEVKLLQRLHHHNIISFHGSWVNRERQEVNFVTEILSSGTLKSFINKVRVIRWKVAKRWAQQILKGLEYLHSQDPPVIHRDLKCDNIFINGTSGDLRIGDLGLSTVHRNNRVHSVLGTPEFMAPDMYEEQSYDEKVDIYAFGMCMLEILTQEIPYSECSNPAQIYKRVSSGESPEVISRVQSMHAREFVLHCLGKKVEDGRYQRPSATELLAHPFLAQRSTDDNDIVVLPPLRESAIQEERDSGTISQEMTARQHAQSNATQEDQYSHTSTPAPAPNHRRSTTDSLDEDDGDQFNDMPQSETNIKNVKVLIGRGQALEDDDEPPPPPPAAAPSAGANSKHQDVAPIQPLVSAVVFEHSDPNVRPYADDKLKLVVTLAINGQNQTVQFDFHLVRDDPIKVAKEMVHELEIPETAILQVSESISGLACEARKKQEKYHVRTQEMIQAAQQVSGQLQHGAQFQVQPQAAGTMAPVPVGQQALAPAPMGVPLHVQAHHEVMPTQQQQVPQNAVHQQTQGFVTHAAAVNAQGVPLQPPSYAQGPYNGSQLQIPVQTGAPAMHNYQPHENGSSGVYADPRPVNAAPTQQTVLAQLPPPSHPSNGAGDPNVMNFWNGTNGQPAPYAQHQRDESFDMGAKASTGQGHRTPATSTSDALGSSSSITSSTGHGSPKAPDLLGPTNVASASLQLSDINSNDSDDEELNAELRKLDEDFHKNLQRATKVFNNRMDSLQRSQVEREAQHRKTLMKHEKDKVEFEKRRLQEEEQQNRRLEMMQKEWDKKRETLVQQQKQDDGSLTPTEVVVPPPISHVRSTSTASSALSMSPAAPPQRKSPMSETAEGKDER